MYSDVELDRRPAPAPWRREFYLTVLIMAFTMAQVWAVMVVLTTVRSDGPSLLAIMLTLAGAAVAVLNGWRYILRRNRHHVDHLTRN
jgi:hypothetical protein